jgi:hypothetical protein
MEVRRLKSLSHVAQEEEVEGLIAQVRRGWKAERALREIAG